MKKLALALVLVFAFTLTVLANPFVDVPLNHWAYDAVQSLSAKGIIVGYPDGTFGGAKSLTRYEFAEAVAKALAYVEGMDFAAADDVVVLEKLAIEFADELASLGVTVADLEAALGANTEAIAALEETVAKHETFFEPVVITGAFTATYTKAVSPMAVATLSDETEINIEATINDETTAGITVVATDVLSGAPAYDVTWEAFFIDYQGEYLQLRVGEVEPATIGLGLIYHFDTLEEFDGFLATWIWDEEDADLGDWTLFGDVEDFYILNVAFALGDEDEVDVSVTGSLDPLAGGSAGGADIAFNLGEEDEVDVAIEGAVFYTTALSYAAAVSVETAVDDLDLAIDAYYALPGFVPTNSDYTADTLGIEVELGYPLTEEDADTDVDGTLTWAYEMDSAMAAATDHTVKAALDFLITDTGDEDTDETAELSVEYGILSGETTAYGEYMRYPLTDEFTLSGRGEYGYPSGTYDGAVTLVYDYTEDIDILLEGRLDSDSGTAIWSAEVQLVYALAENTELKLGFEQNDWDDDINDYDEMLILDAVGTLYAELAVEF